jgi:AbiV family abortive infection protein
MKLNYPKNYSTVLRFEQHLFHNAYNLAIDSCILYIHESYPTSFSLAVLAYEELGKLHLVDHVGFEARLSPSEDWDGRLEHLFVRGRKNSGLIFKHRVKQGWATVGGWLKDSSELDRIDELKQLGFYVGFEKGRIKTPDQISAHRAFRQIKRVIKVFDETQDLAFYGVWDDSDEESQRAASEYINKLHDAFSELQPPATKRKQSQKN